MIQVQSTEALSAVSVTSCARPFEAALSLGGECRSLQTTQHDYYGCEKCSRSVSLGLTVSTMDRQGKGKEQGRGCMSRQVMPGCQAKTREWGKPPIGLKVVFGRAGVRANASCAERARGVEETMSGRESIG